MIASLPALRSLRAWCGLMRGNCALATLDPLESLMSKRRPKPMTREPPPRRVSKAGSSVTAAIPDDRYKQASALAANGQTNDARSLYETLKSKLTDPTHLALLSSDIASLAAIEGDLDARARGFRVSSGSRPRVRSTPEPTSPSLMRMRPRIHPRRHVVLQFLQRRQ